MFKRWYCSKCAAVLVGYPPRDLHSYNPASTLQSLGFHTGETLFLEELAPEKARTLYPETTNYKESKVDTSSGSVDSPSARKMGGVLPCPPTLSPQGELTRRVVPADNSCLFRSVSVLLGDSGDSCGEVRELAVAIIMSDPCKYDSALLGKTNQEYVEWLRKKESWGGAIELRVLSEHYKVELNVVDIQTLRIDRFGEDKGFPTRAFLLYDGIHYDPLVRSGGGGVASPQQGVFPIGDSAVVQEALEIARKAKKARHYTDISQFALRCLVCGEGLKGQKDAVAHATRTGHSNFGEV